jgi:hypothetical protein
MKITTAIMFVCAVLTALFGDVQNAIFIMLMAIYTQGAKE